MVKRKLIYQKEILMALFGLPEIQFICNLSALKNEMKDGTLTVRNQKGDRSIVIQATGEDTFRILETSSDKQTQPMAEYIANGLNGSDIESLLCMFRKGTLSLMPLSPRFDRKVRHISDLIAGERIAGVADLVSHEETGKDWATFTTNRGYKGRVRLMSGTAVITLRSPGGEEVFHVATPRLTEFAIREILVFMLMLEKTHFTTQG